MKERVDRAVAQVDAMLDEALRKAFDFEAGLAAVEADARSSELEERAEGEILYLPSTPVDATPADVHEHGVYFDALRDFYRNAAEYSQEAVISAWQRWR